MTIWGLIAAGFMAAIILGFLVPQKLPVAGCLPPILAVIGIAIWLNRLPGDQRTSTDVLAIPFGGLWVVIGSLPGALSARFLRNSLARPSK